MLSAAVLRCLGDIQHFQVSQWWERQLTVQLAAISLPAKQHTTSIHLATPWQKRKENPTPFLWSSSGVYLLNVGPFCDGHTSHTVKGELVLTSSVYCEKSRVQPHTGHKCLIHSMLQSPVCSAIFILLSTVRFSAMCASIRWVHTIYCAYKQSDCSNSTLILQLFQLLIFN